MPRTHGLHGMLSIYLVTLLLATTSISSAATPTPTSPVITFGNSSIVGALFQPSNVQFFGGVCDLIVFHKDVEHHTLRDTIRKATYRNTTSKRSCVADRAPFSYFPSKYIRPFLPSKRKEVMNSWCFRGHTRHTGDSIHFCIRGLSHVECFSTSELSYHYITSGYGMDLRRSVNYSIPIMIFLTSISILRFNFFGVL